MTAETILFRRSLASIRGVILRLHGYTSEGKDNAGHLIHQRALTFTCPLRHSRSLLVSRPNEFLFLAIFVNIIRAVTGQLAASMESARVSIRPLYSCEDIAGQSCTMR